MDPVILDKILERLPGIIGATFSGIAAIIAAVGVILIKKNTNLTVKGQQDLYEKVDSAERAVSSKVESTGQEVIQDGKKTAQVVSIIAAKTVNTAAVANQEVLNAIAPIAEKMNGGPGGLHELSTRMASMEGKHELLAQGHIEIKTALDRMASEFREVASEIKKQSKY